MDMAEPSAEHSGAAVNDEPDVAGRFAGKPLNSREVIAKARAAELVAEAEAAAAEQAKAFAAAQALAARAAQAQAEAEKAAREAAEAEMAALREIEEAFPTFEVAEQMERAQLADSIRRRGAEARLAQLSSPPPLFGPMGSSALGRRAQQQAAQHLAERSSNTSDEGRRQSRADEATTWRRQEPPTQPKIFVPAPKPEREAWTAAPTPPPVTPTHILVNQSRPAGSASNQQRSTPSARRSWADEPAPPSPPPGWSHTSASGASQSPRGADGTRPSLKSIQAREEGAAEARKKLEELKGMGFPATLSAEVLLQCGGDVRAAAVALQRQLNIKPSGPGFFAAESTSGAPPAWQPKGPLRVMTRPLT